MKCKCAALPNVQLQDFTLEWTRKKSKASTKWYCTDCGGEVMWAQPAEPTRDRPHVVQFQVVRTDDEDQVYLLQSDGKMYISGKIRYNSRRNGYETCWDKLIH